MVCQYCHEAQPSTKALIEHKKTKHEDSTIQNIKESQSTNLSPSECCCVFPESLEVLKGLKQEYGSSITNLIVNKKPNITTSLEVAINKQTLNIPFISMYPTGGM